jgi:glutamyl/glutaminyl-tRNA synthetase
MAKFSLDRVQRSGARFDEKRLEWMNGQHIRQLSIDDLFARVENFWPSSTAHADEAYKKQVLVMVQDRLKTLADLPSLTDYFFTEPTTDWSLLESNKQLSKLSQDDINSLLNAAISALENSEFDADSIQNALNSLLETTGQKPGILFSLIRLAVSWAPFSPALNQTLEALGKETTLRRLQSAIR